jgi:hypothetical protein
MTEHPAVVAAIKAIRLELFRLRNEGFSYGLNEAIRIARSRVQPDLILAANAALDEQHGLRRLPTTPDEWRESIGRE